MAGYNRTRVEHYMGKNGAGSFAFVTVSMVTQCCTAIFTTAESPIPVDSFNQK